MNELPITLELLSEKTGRRYHALYKMVRSGELLANKRGKRWYVLPSSYTAWVLNPDNEKAPSTMTGQAKNKLKLGRLRSKLS